MKIVFSPSKEMRDEDIFFIKTTETDIIFSDKNKELVELLQKKSMDEIGKIMKLKGKLLEEIFNNIQGYEKKESIPAISLYNGVSYKELRINEYQKTDLDYLRNNLLILSAMYGVVRAFDRIKKYRLDMTMKIMSQSLYSFWKKEVNQYIRSIIKKDEVVLNLASLEFSKILDKDITMITIDFKEEENGKYKSISSYSKKARGKYLDYCIEKNVYEVENLKKVSIDGYSFNPKISKEKIWVFTRKIKID